jgi:phage-related protein
LFLLGHPGRFKSPESVLIGADYVITCQGSGHRRQFYLEKGSRHREHFLTMADRSNLIHAFSKKGKTWTINRNFDCVAKRYVCI